MYETIRTPIFSRYELLDELGSGGMGTVYKARQKYVGRLVAFKVLPPGMREDKEAMQRFEREAEALGRLKHPHVVTVFDAGVEGGFPYLAMEFIEGQDLRKVLKERTRLSVEEVVRLGIEMADALDHLSGKDLVHRDVKPSNIVFSPDGRAVLTDFGIAFAATMPRITQGAMGTPEFMSPEQADGKPLDIRTDLYSLGVVLYECLTGQVPFERQGESLTSLTSLLQQIMHEGPPAIETLQPEAPAWLCEAIMQCLQKEPEQRYQTGAALADVLRAGQSSEALPSEHPASEHPASEHPASEHPASAPGVDPRPPSEELKTERTAAVVVPLEPLPEAPKAVETTSPVAGPTPPGQAAVDPLVDEVPTQPQPEQGAARSRRRRRLKTKEPDARLQIEEKRQDKLARREKRKEAARSKLQKPFKPRARVAFKTWLVLGLVLFGFLFLQFATAFPLADWLLVLNTLSLTPALTGALVTMLSGTSDKSRVGKGVLTGSLLGMVFSWSGSGLLIKMMDNLDLFSSWSGDELLAYGLWNLGVVVFSAFVTGVALALKFRFSTK